MIPHRTLIIALKHPIVPCPHCLCKPPGVSIGNPDGDLPPLSNLMLREVKSLAQGHRDGKWLRQAGLRPWMKKQ